MMSTSDRFSEAIAAFDAYHSKDPGTAIYSGKVLPSELLYAIRMTERLRSFAPDADESVKIAARCQHIGRWEIPRAKYPKDRKGYLQWRNEEKMHHARIAETILTQCGYSPGVIEKVKFLLMKKELNSNADTQVLEDVACLVFLEFYLEDFTTKHDDDKVVDILRKTLKKMSARAKTTAASLDFSPRIRSLIERAMTSQ